MGTFLRGRFPITNEKSFVQGAGRMLIAPAWAAMPVGATQYDPVAPWQDVGYTKTGINITRNNAEETFDVDQIRADIMRRPSNWEMSVGTQLEEATLETFALAWELDHSPATGTATTPQIPVVTSVTKTPPQNNENQVGLSAPTSYIERKLAVVFQFPSGLIRTFVFRRALKAPQEAGFTLNKTGEQVSLPIRFTCLPDPAQSVSNQFGYIFEQV
jgi:hypothetical protein